MDPVRPPRAVSLPESVRLVEGSGGLPRLDVATPLATGQVYLHGAHVTAWQPAHTDAPVLWMSGHSFFQDQKPIRGGVPICFPWFGPHATAAGAPAHGFARLSDWRLADVAESADGVVALAFDLDETIGTSPLWPHRYAATFRVRIGRTLEMNLEVRNTGAQPFTFEEALHTYFVVRDIAAVRIAGLDGVEYVDKVGEFAHRRQDEELIAFTQETDRVYLDSRPACAIHDPSLGRRITVAKSSSGATVVWNPWIKKAQAMADFGDDEWRGMVCVETANVGTSAIPLEPGAAHTMSARLSVDRL